MIRLFIIIIIFIGVVLLSIYLMQFNNTTPHQLLWSQCYQDKYPEKVLHMDKISKEKILFMVPAFNSSIKKLKNKINYLVEGFLDYKIFIYGLDSTMEETLQDLNNWQVEDNKIYLVPPINIRHLPRTVRIGTIRNEILTYIKSMYLDNWWAIAYDSDHLGPMSKLGLIDSILRLKMIPEVYSICASGTVSGFPGMNFLYDSYAYRDINDHKFKTIMHSFLSDYTKIISGFSGAVLYRWDELKNFSYQPTTNICEHISLNKSLKGHFDRKYKKKCYMEMSKIWHIYVGLQPSVG